MTIQKPMNADEINELAAKILKAIQPLESDPYRRMAALRTAAHAIENVITAGIIKQAVLTGLAQILGAPKGES